MFEKRGIPTVYVVEGLFENDAEVTCWKEGMPSLRRVIVSHSYQPANFNFPELMPKLADALTKPLTEEEKKAGKITSEVMPRVAMTGTMEEINNYFMENKWGDGLPIVPPTEELVQRFLKNTSHAPDEVVATTVWPEEWTATVEKVAIVGAMAGCKPEYMPVLLAVIEAFGSAPYSAAVRSTQSFNFMVLVNGPIRNEIGMESQHNAMGPCNQANATIGRFLRLAIINLGGSWPGINEMSIQGSPTKYGFCFAENEEQSAWEPFHVSAGFKPEESAVSIGTGGFAHASVFIPHYPDPIVVLNRLAKALTSAQLPRAAVVMIDPESVKIYMKLGMSKKENFEQFVWEHATATIEHMRLDVGWEMIEQTFRGFGEQGLWPENLLELPDDAVVQVLPPNSIKVVVVGYPLPVMQFWTESSLTTKSVDKWR
jgi:hypothetical protein